MNNSAPLNINKVTKSFDKKIVLNEISLSVKKGKIYGIAGLNGIGKTTLFKIILGLISEYKGEISVFGNSPINSETKKSYGFLPEKFHPSFFLKGKEFLQLACSYADHEYKKEDAEKYAELLNLDEEALNQRISKYSKGMVQKLGLISLLMPKTSLLLLDEPMSGLDPKARIQIKSALKQAKEGGTTIFFSSHILSDMEEICDNMAVLHNSNILFEGKPTQLRKLFKSSSLEQSFLQCIEDNKIDSAMV